MISPQNLTTSLSNCLSFQYILKYNQNLFTLAKLNVKTCEQYFCRKLNSVCSLLLSLPYLLNQQKLSTQQFGHKQKLTKIINLMRIALIGSYGQVGQELIRSLSKKVGIQNIICCDVNNPPAHLNIKHHITLNSVDTQAVENVIQKYSINQIYCLSALLSATGEVNPLRTEQINMKTLYNCLEACRKFKVDRLFWPSSIAAFGPDTPKDTPQETVMNPTTVYGITKKAGELWCAYYYKRYGVDVRSLRYPGLIGYRSMPGGGTTDYAVDIFHKALKGETFKCYLKPDAYLPMIYTDDAIEGTIQLMEAPRQNVKIRTSYNISGMSFCPSQIAAEIKKHIPSFKIQYQIDPLRQGIADSWPHRLADADARKDWGFKPKYDLATMTKEILQNLKV